MKKILAVAVLLSLVGPAFAQSSPRYQAIQVASGEESANYSAVLILDTQDGHIWLWRAFRGAGSDGPRTELVYEGAMEVPVRKMEAKDLFPMVKER